MNNKKDKNISQLATLRRVIKMIKYLRENGRTKGAELSKHLGLKNSKSIYMYKNFCHCLGYDIKSTHGYYGGYELIEDALLTNDELKEIKSKLGNNKLFNKIKKVNSRVTRI